MQDLFGLIGASMWFWSVSFADQLSGQFLIFLVGQKKIVPSQRPDIFFVHSLEFFVQSFLKIGKNIKKKSKCDFRKILTINLIPL